MTSQNTTQRLLTRRGSASLATSLVMVLVAACGSSLDPADVRAANGGMVVGGGPGAAQQDPQAPVVGVPADAGDAAPGGVTAGGADGGAAPADAASPADVGAGENSATGTTKAGSCDGFENQTGITDKTITLANASDISGPVPGIFESAQDAAKAYIAYFNATSDICGRKLELMELDTRTDTGGDQQAYAKACSEAFAAVGSMSAFDSGGARTAEECGLPDLRSTTVNTERVECSTCFAAQAVTVNLVQNATPRYFARKHPAAAKKAAFLWINAGAAPANAKSFVAGWERNGFDVVYEQPIDVSEFNYAPFVQQMEEKGVRYVQYLGPYQNSVKLAQAMRDQGFKPDVFAQDPTGYDQRFVESGGSAVEGTRVFLNITPFEEARSNRELQLYLAWLQQVHPNAVPTFYGVFAWSATRLLVEEATALGGRLSRAALVDRIRRVDGWTSNGIHSPQHVGSKRTGECWRIVRLERGRWVPETARRYMCQGTVDTGVR